MNFEVPVIYRSLKYGRRAIDVISNDGFGAFLRLVIARLIRDRGVKDDRTEIQQEILRRDLFSQAYSAQQERALERTFQQVLAYTMGLSSVESPELCIYSRRSSQPLLYASVYAALIRHLLGDMNHLSVREKETWTVYINSFQCSDGLYRDLLLDNELAEKEDWWGWRHLSAHVVTALTALGGKTRQPFSFLQFLYQPGEARRWITHLPWRERPAYVSNTVMNYGVMLQYDRDFWHIDAAGKALEQFYEFLDEIQDPASGLWGNLPAKSPHELSIAVQTAYHLWNLYFYDSRSVQYVERAIDSCLATQNELGGYGATLNSSACEDMDSIDPLSRFYFLANYRRQDIRQSLQKVLPWVLVNQLDDGGFVFSRFQGFTYGHALMTTGAEESHLFGTWFRTLSLAYVCQVLDLPGFPASSWHWVKCPGYQFWQIAQPTQAETA